MNLNEIADALKINLSSSVALFGNNEMLYIRFLKKFPNDKTFQALVDAVNSENYEEIEKSAHTLKGISANLGFSELKSKSDNMVICIRNKNYSEIKNLFDIVDEEYNNIINLIATLD